MSNIYNKKEDIIEFKPGIYGVNINFNALWRRLKMKPNVNQTLVVAQRFEQIFNYHGITTTQIPRLIPEVTLDKLNSLESLTTVLTDEVIEKAATLFQVRRAWLEGASPVMYDCLDCYKKPVDFFEDISNLDFDFKTITYPIVVFCRTEKISHHSNRKKELLVPVLIEKIIDLEDKQINRYKIYGDEWNWNYWKGRLQLRAMFRVLHKNKGTIIPLIKVSSQILDDISSGRVVPNPYLGKRLNNISFEDFVLYPDESSVSKESEDLPQVIEYIEKYDLENVARRILGEDRVF